jgi:hypothetical protein
MTGGGVGGVAEIFWVSLDMVSRIWFSLFPIPATVSSRLDTRSLLSISTERKESMDDEVVCEGGVHDSDCSKSVEPL